MSPTEEAFHNVYNASQTSTGEYTDVDLVDEDGFIRSRHDKRRHSSKSFTTVPAGRYYEEVLIVVFSPMISGKVNKFHLDKLSQFLEGLHLVLSRRYVTTCQEIQLQLTPKHHVERDF